MLKSILLACEESTGVERAFAFALQLAHAFHARLYIVSVVDPALKDGDQAKGADARCAATHRSFRATAQRVGVALSCEISSGRFIDVVVKQAVDLGVDHVVVGDLAKGDIDRGVSWSLPHLLMSESPVSLTVIR